MIAAPAAPAVRAVRAALWRPLCAAALLTFAALGASLAAGSAAAGPTTSLHGQPCGPDGCALAPPTAEERAALAAEAERLLARYADDTTALGRECHALGATMQARVGDVRMIAYMWRELDEDGYLAPVTGDAHRVEAVPGSGRVHIARGYDALNPARGLPAILQTARHEFAHLNGAPQSRLLWRIDDAERLATLCGPPGGDD